MNETWRPYQIPTEITKDNLSACLINNSKLLETTKT